jgi:coenzyme F420-reducing hydrogenase delta subunit/Fe-S-cluster-containing hydrogenase component 2
MIRVMCSGRVDLEFVLRAFANGMDGVFIGGCRLNECNYITHGNYDALNMVLLCRKLMEHIGLNPDRLGLAFLSSGEGNLFAKAVDNFTQKVRELGPIGSAEETTPEKAQTELKKVRRLVPYIKIEKKEKLASRLRDEADHDQLFSREEIAELLNEAVSYHIDPAKCQACMICLRQCPADAIIGAKKQIHVIDQDKCIKCGTCLEACPPRFGAVNKLTREPVPPPLAEEDRAISGKR